ncbi:peroxin [Lobosporangium transversale]|uniref:Peroxin-3 n=1 Tax=Lobosporangium transversale TaxID=64571 RepID=A0A1Y2GXI0_9FUNG|nr:Peroxin-3 [Lobosporangium transversale]KAF9914587.1 peroxin [Lobosporangium transversale]ORZ22743.1 Peroxin-3 [Lobosporangium transversale]|eukprot:XP_021883297.1 Peroxin-3 [Lobosporangium transversale]
MLSAVQGFVSRHRRGLAVTAGVTGGIYLMGKYAKTKLIEFQEKSASERTAKENMKRRFEQNQQDCVFTVLSLLPTLGDQLLHELNVELITTKLQQSRSQRSTPMPTPDSSMILPPKPLDDTEASTAAAVVTSSEDNGANGVNQQQQPIDQTEETSKDDQVLAAEKTATQELEVNSKINGRFEKHEADANAENGHIVALPDKEVEVDKEIAQEESVANGSTSEEKAQEAKETEQEKEKEQERRQEQEKEQDSTERNVSEESTARLQATAIDETAALIDRRVKLELWTELKIMSFTRTITALYSLTLLTLLTQIQLNLLGRFTYVSSVVALSNTTDASYRVESPAPKGSLTSVNGLLDFQTEKKYLTFSYWLLHEGWRRWSEKVREVVDDIVGSISLKRTFTAKEFSELLAEIRSRLEYAEVDGKRIPINMREYMLPDDVAEEYEVLRAGGVDEADLTVDPMLRNLLDETRDFIDSNDFATVLSSTLATTFARFNLAFQPTFNPFLLTPPRNPGSGIEEIENEDDMDRAVPLASLLPLVTRQVHLIINGVPNEYVESLALVKDLQAFSAIVYSSFSEQLMNH